jgi:putative ATP-binding cassette transporter
MFLKEFNSLLKQKNGISLSSMIILGFFSGISGTLIITIINKVIRLDPQNKTFFPNLFVGFIAVLGVYFIVQAIYQISLIRLSHNMIWKLRLMTLDNVRHADYLKFLSFGSNKVHSILTRDAYDLSQFSQMLSTVIVSIVTIITGLGYLLWVSPLGCLITLSLSACIVAVNLVTRKKIDLRVNKARKMEEEYNKYFLSVLEGVKELKLDQKKSDDLFTNYVMRTGDQAQKMWADVSTRFYTNGVIGQLFFYLIIALFLFVLPYLHISLLPDSFEYILIVLYLMGPTNVVINAVPSFSYARKALRRFNDLKKLEEAREIKVDEQPLFPSHPCQLSFHDLSFTYRSNDEAETFSIGPLNFNLEKGEIVFLTGGNGSGKSTFVRLLSGLYSPHSGYIKIDQQRVYNIQQDAYRSLFSVIYTDGYLFDTLLGFNSNHDQEMNKILRDLGLGSKVKSKDHIFSTTDLSFGQRKRLSLAVSILEDKPIYIFDELAANQDMEFKEYFYYTILDGLKKKGKIVIVVTHDEKYFHIADKHYKMDDGKLRCKEKIEMV